MPKNHERLNAALMALQYLALRSALLEGNLRLVPDPAIRKMADDVLQVVGETAVRAIAAYEHLADFLNAVDAVDDTDGPVTEPLFAIMNDRD